MRTGSALAAFALTAVVLSACGDASPGVASGDPTETPTLTPTPTAAPTGPPWPTYAVQDYTYVLRVSCYCVDANTPYLVTVVGGRVSSVVDKATGEPAEDYRGLSINDLIAAANEPADTVEVTWHDDEDYPTKIFIDRDTNMADEEVWYTIRNVEPS